MKMLFDLAVCLCGLSSGAMAGVCPVDEVLTTQRELESAPELNIEHFTRWENKTDKPVILISTDVVLVETMNDPAMNMH
jgi:hypothetical protein